MAGDILDELEAIQTLRECDGDRLVSRQEVLPPKRLALTHFYPPVEDVDVRAIVGARYAGPVTLAVDGWHFDIEDM